MVPVRKNRSRVTGVPTIDLTTLTVHALHDIHSILGSRPAHLILLISIYPSFILLTSTCL